MFVFSLSYLPFSDLVPWANLSLSLRAEDFAAFGTTTGTTLPNPLHQLRDLVAAEPRRVRAMQAALADARWYLHYRTPNVPGNAPELRRAGSDAGMHVEARNSSTVNSGVRPSAGWALVHHLVLAAKQRLRALRGGGDGTNGCGLETLSDVGIYR